MAPITASTIRYLDVPSNAQYSSTQTLNIYGGAAPYNMSFTSIPQQFGIRVNGNSANSVNDIGSPTFTINNANPSITLELGEHSSDMTPGQYNIVVLIWDNYGNEVVTMLLFSIVAAITVPVTITDISNFTTTSDNNSIGISNINVPFNMKIGVNNNVTYTWKATNLPDGLSINSSTGTITGTPTVLGQNVVTVIAEYTSNYIPPATFAIPVTSFTITVTDIANGGSTNNNEPASDNKSNFWKYFIMLTIIVSIVVIIIVFLPLSTIVGFLPSISTIKS